MATYWHILKSTKRFGVDAVQTIWQAERAASIVTAGYGNEPDGPGRARLLRYRPGDHVLIYVPGFGAVGLAEVVGTEPDHAPKSSHHEHAHSLAVRYRTAVDRLDHAVTPGEIRRAGGYIPRTPWPCG